MSFRSLASLRVAAFFAVSLLLTACEGDRPELLSGVETIEVPDADPGTQTNQNIANPTLVIPDTFPVSEGDELTLVWSEEFDGPEINPETWFFATGDGTEKGLPGGWGNNELQYYLPDNAQIVNGVLEITARRETVGDFNYTSARINTEDRFAFKYGRIEASMKLPSGQGLWPAFWMLSQDSDYVCGVDDQGNDRPCVWAAIGEIDIVEAINLDGTNGNEIFATIHYGGEFPANQSSSVTYTPAADVTESFNTYAIEWDANEIRWYFNGLLYASQDSWNSAALNGGPSAPFDQNFHVLLNLAVGGNFPGSPNGTTPFPATMEVDWVRVYSGEDPSGSAATEPNVSAPTPTEDAASVISLFSDAYTNITGIDYNPNWNQGTVVTIAQIAGNKMLKYAGLDYQGTDFSGNPQDVSGKGFLHLDFWTADSTALNVYLISPGPVETAYSLTEDIAPNSWVSVDIPLSEFAGVDLANLIQLKFDGNGTIFLDNLYFAGEAPIPAMGGEVPDDVIVAADGSAPDLTPAFDPFGSGTNIVTDFAGDYSYDNAVEVTVGAGYGGGALAQVGLTGLTPGFAGSYGELLFKVKGLTADNTIVVKLEEPFPGLSVPVQIDLTAPPANVTVTDLGDGWSQVVIQVAAYGDVSTFSQIVFQTLDAAYAVGDKFYLTDIGFNAALATGGEVPGAAIIAADGSTPDLVLGTDFTAFEAFGTGGSNDYAFAGDSSYDNVVAITPGAGYGGGSLGQFGIVGFTAGFATAYDALLFKVKGLADNTVVVKLEEPFPGASTPVTVDLTAPPAGVTVTDLGDGWSQVVIPISSFGDVSTFSQIVIESVPGSQAEGSAFYVTDVGFTSSGATGGEVPEVVIIAADGSTPDLAPGSGFTQFTVFGTGGAFDAAFAGDSSYANAIEVTVGPGYGGGALAQLGIEGFAAGFASGYGELLFKVKGLVADNTIQVKLEEPFPGTSVPVQVDLTAPPANVTVTDLGDGWSQVVIQMAAYGDVSTFSQIVFQTLDGAYAAGDTFYLTDIGFNNAGATGGEVPEVVIIAADGSTPDLAPGSGFTQFTVFGTGGAFDAAFAGDSSYANAIEVTVGPGYGGGALAQLGIEGFAAGFASGYGELLFKVKGLVADNTIQVKLEEPFPGTSVPVQVDLTAPPANVTVTDLGDGWSQVVIQMAAYGDVSTFSQIVFQTLDGAYAAGDTFYLTDIGFNNAGATGGEVPEVVIIAADGSTPDLAPGSGFTQFTVFGTGGAFDAAFAGDSSYANAIEVTVGPGYGGGALAQLGIEGFAAGFASGYGELLFKVKGLVADNTIQVKLEEPFPGTSVPVQVDLTAPPANVTVTDLGDGWSQVVIQMAAYGDVSTFSQIVFQTLDGAYAAGDTFYLTDIGFNNAGGGTGVELTTNGDFEAGDISGWEDFSADNNGTFTATMAEANGGLWSGNLVASVPGGGGPASFPVVKQANLGIGTVQPNSTVTVSFDLKGSIVGTGGVIFVEFFSELSGGGTSQAGIISQPVPTSSWVNFSIPVTTGNDVSGGVTLQLKADCGANPGCTVDAYFDNVSVVTN